MKRILALALLLFSLQLFAGTASSDEQKKENVNVELSKGDSDKMIIGNI